MGSERETDRHRQTETERDKERERYTHTQTETERVRDREREKKDLLPRCLGPLFLERNIQPLKPESRRGIEKLSNVRGFYHIMTNKTKRVSGSHRQQGRMLAADTPKRF